MAKNNDFDQFYTNPLTAKKLTSIFTEEIKKLGYQKLISSNHPPEPETFAKPFGKSTKTTNLSAKRY